MGCKNGHKVVFNELLENYCKVLNKHVIGHVLARQNEGSTIVSLILNLIKC